jgi:endonuclease III
MVIENLASKKKRTLAIIKGLRTSIADREIELTHKDPLQLLVATILSAQCTDKRVNMVTPGLFKKYKTAKHYAAAKLKAIEKEIKSTGFYHAKAKSITGAAKAIVKDHDGKVPQTMEELTKLPGVGRKTANVVLGNAFDTPGLVVDTHVKRISNRLGLTKHQDPTKIEFDLEKVVPKRDWVEFSHLLIKHGRRTCPARKPKCASCRVSRYCPSREDVKQICVGLQRKK